MSADRNSSTATANRAGGGRRLKASDHAKGTSVYAPDGNRLGRIERVMVDEATGEIVDAVVSFAPGNGIGMEADEHPVPWSLLAYNSRFDGYELRITDRQALRRGR
jgi:sporulation protein YlmC with PRC-barrel domain